MMGPAALSLSDKLLNSNCLSSHAFDSRRESLISNFSEISSPFYSSSPLPDNQMTDSKDIKWIINYLL